MQMPIDIGTLVAYIVLFLVIWYAIVWSARLVMSIVWPLFIISAAIVVFRILQHYDPEEVLNIITKSVTVVADTLVIVLAKGLDCVLSFFG